MRLRDSFVSDGIENISEKNIISLSIIFFEFYRRVVKFFFECLGIKKPFAVIFFAKFLSPLLRAHGWQLEDVTYENNLLTAKWLLDQALVSEFFGKIIFHQKIYTVDGVCVDHTDFVDDDEGYVDKCLYFGFFEFVFSIFFIDEIGLDLFGKYVFYAERKKRMNRLSSDIER